MRTGLWKLLVGSVFGTLILSAGCAFPQEPANFAIWGGFFKPFTEHLNGDWIVGADWRHSERFYLGLRYFRSKDSDTHVSGKGLALLVGLTFPFDKGSFEREGVIYRIGAGAGLNRLEVSGKGRTYRGMVEVFMEAITKRNLSVRLSGLVGGLDGNNGWSVALGLQF